jgi:hypothetical protein
MFHQGIGADIRPGTWVVYGFETVSVPEGIPQGGAAVNDLELWESQRRNSELMGRINKQGLEDKMYEKFDKGS